MKKFTLPLILAASLLGTPVLTQERNETKTTLEEKIGEKEELGIYHYDTYVSSSLISKKAYLGEAVLSLNKVDGENYEFKFNIDISSDLIKKFLIQKIDYHVLSKKEGVRYMPNISKLFVLKSQFTGNQTTVEQVKFENKSVLVNGMLISVPENTTDLLTMLMNNLTVEKYPLKKDMGNLFIQGKLIPIESEIVYQNNQPYGFLKFPEGSISKTKVDILFEYKEKDGKYKLCFDYLAVFAPKAILYQDIKAELFLKRKEKQKQRETF